MRTSSLFLFCSGLILLCGAILPCASWADGQDPQYRDSWGLHEKGRGLTYYDGLRIGVKDAKGGYDPQPVRFVKPSQPRKPNPPYLVDLEAYLTGSTNRYQIKFPDKRTQ